MMAGHHFFTKETVQQKISARNAGPLTMDQTAKSPYNTRFGSTHTVYSFVPSPKRLCNHYSRVPTLSAVNRRDLHTGQPSRLTRTGAVSARRLQVTSGGHARHLRPQPKKVACQHRSWSKLVRHFSPGRCRLRIEWASFTISFFGAFRLFQIEQD